MSLALHFQHAGVRKFTLVYCNSRINNNCSTFFSHDSDVTQHIVNNLNKQQPNFIARPAHLIMTVSDRHNCHTGEWKPIVGVQIRAHLRH